MNHHDLGRGRAGLAMSLSRITARTTVVGIDTDRLYPLRQQEQLVALIPSSHQLVVIHSLNGHDAFLTEATAVGDILVTALAEVLA
jgi:homoserine O-acetyltransferase